MTMSNVYNSLDINICKLQFDESYWTQQRRDKWEDDGNENKSVDKWRKRILKLKL